MDFFKRFFGTQTKTPKYIPSKRTLKDLTVQNSHPNLPPKTANLVNQKTNHKNNCEINRAVIAPFNLKRQAELIPTKLISINTESVDCHLTIQKLGYLVGVVNKQKAGDEIIPQECFRLPIGSEEEVSSLRNLRGGVVDSLLFFWNLDKSTTIFQEIMLRHEKVIILFKKFNHFKTMLFSFEEMLLKKFGKYDVTVKSNFLHLNIFESKGMLVAQFQNQQNGKIKTIDRLKSFCPALIEMDNQRILKKIKLFQYLQCTHQSESQMTSSILEGITDAIRKQIQLQRKLEQTVNQLVKKQAQISRKKQEEQEEDWEIEYFGKRESQKETRQSGSKRHDLQDFYYFLEDHDDNESSSNNEDKQSNHLVNTICYSPKHMVRSKSWNSLPDLPEPELDDQFFNKQ